MEIPITDFELSVRSRNCLKRMNIRTLGDLTRVTESQLLASKNFGETSLEEIKAIMNAKGLRIGQSLEQGQQYEFRYRPQQNLSPEEQATLNKPVSDLNLSVRARKCMNRLNITTLGELIQRTADELLEAKNFGMTSLTEVRERLAAAQPEAAGRLTSRVSATEARSHRDATRVRSATDLSASLCLRVSVVTDSLWPFTFHTPPRRSRPRRAAHHAARAGRDARRSCPSARRRPSRG